MNIGTNPTVDGQHLSVEIHYLNFNNDLYDAEIRVSILKRLRDEQKFDSLPHLKKQLQLDQKLAFAIIESL